MAIKDAPITFRTYYKKLIEDYTQIKKEALEKLEELNTKATNLQKEIKEKEDIYKNEYNIELSKYEEFVNNRYINGIFIRVAKGAYVNSENDYIIIADLYDLYDLAKTQKDIISKENEIEFANKILGLNLKQYHKILQTFYFAVHKKMILNGYGYVFEDNLGWTCINRCKLEKVKHHIDFAATRKKKEEILARGGRLYNKEEADWCLQHGIPYNGEKYTVTQNIEVCYEVPLIDCKLPNGRKYKLEIADTRGREVRGKTNEQLIEETNGNLEKIVDLNVGLRTKLNICVELNKILYTNFIRNENQKPINTVKIDRQN